METLDPGLLKIARQAADRLAAAGFTPGRETLLEDDKGWQALASARCDRLYQSMTRRRGGRGSAGLAEPDFLVLSEMGMAIADHYRVALRHFMAGQRIYYCADGLVDRLLHTKASVPVELIRLPLSQVLFVIEEEQALPLFDNLIPDPLRKRRPLTVALNEEVVPNGRCLTLQIMQFQGSKGLVSYNHAIILDPALPLDAVIAMNWQLDDLGESVSSSEAMALQDRNPDFRSHRSVDMHARAGPLLSLIVNLLLNIGSAAPELGRPRRNDRSTAGDTLNYSPREHIVVGQSITRLLRYNEPADRAKSPQGGRKLASHSIVAGHWKAQPFGPRQSERRVIWIEPYRRGPDVAALVARPVLVS